jgi:putative heme-binding domain-containing protein
MAGMLDTAFVGVSHLDTVKDPPALQMLVPGFTARALPLELPNLNNVKYRADGKVYALGYNGQIWLLSDSKGSGMEDHAELFWDGSGGKLRGPIGMALTPPGYARGQGVFVPSKGKLSLIVDTNGDDKADAEIIVANGWRETPHGVGTLGVAVAADQSIYFGIGNSNFTDAYSLDRATGKSSYDLAAEYGTIQHVSADFSRRETVCTGIRFSVGMAFNRYGDLFCTDQEGATWLANGNPLDELLHIETGRHYGFPPRHPRHLPNVIDEPSVFDYAPQHQSTCGLNFNESVNGGPPVGPAWWTGDAIIAGESRGKIFRTKIVKTAAGYVAKNQIIACLTNLVIDVCVSPRGDLLVTTHSGMPDWGSGPNGIGRLWKISYTQPSAPQPVAAWSAGPTELRIGFDQALDPAQLRELAKRIKLTQGKYVTAGDRFEFIRPGYQAVQDQLALPRFEVPVLGVTVSTDRRTLTVRTPPLTSAMNCSITIAATSNGKAYDGDLDLAADLSGVETKWSSADGKQTVTGWLPHADLAVSREFTAASAEHEQLRALMQTPGTLVLRGQLDLWQMLQPAIQPGAKLDWDPPAEKVTVVFTSPSAFSTRFENSSLTPAKSVSGRFEASANKLSGEGKWLPFEITLATGAGGKVPELTAYWFTADDPRPRAFPVRRFLVPWAVPRLEPAFTSGPRVIAEIAGGDWKRGHAVFFSDAAQCFKCHTIRGEGGHVGPDLSNLVFRDYASVLKDIREPSAAINPDHIAYIVELTDGESLTGIILESGTDRLVVADATATPHVVPKTKVKSMRPSTVSLMPEGLDQALGPEKLRDLMTFLLVAPAEGAPIKPLAAPGGKVSKVGGTIQAVILTGLDGPFHNWQSTSAALKEELEQDKRFRVRVVTDPEFLATDELFKTDVLIQHYVNWQRPGLSERAKANLLKFVNDGHGLAIVHFANGAFNATLSNIKESDWPDYRKLLVRRWWDFPSGSGHDNYAPYRVTPTAVKHPITAGLEAFDTTDELYCQQMGDLPIEPLVTAPCKKTGKDEPLALAYSYGQGRIFQCMLGHSDVSMHAAGELFRRGIAWAADRPPVMAKLEPAPIMVQEPAPPLRKRAEVEAILGTALTTTPAAGAKSLRIVLCASDKDAGHNFPGLHDYPIWRERWSQLFCLADGVTVETADNWPSAKQWQEADVIAINSYNPAWALEKNPAKVASLGGDIDQFLARGGGLVFLHYALNAGPTAVNADALASRLGLAWRAGPSKFRHGASDWILDKAHPLAAGFGRWQIPDESYWNLTGDLAVAGAQVLASCVEENAMRPQMWTREVGNGRVFVSIPGHFTWTYDDPLYRILIFRGMMWSAHQPIDRLAPLVMVGARVE